MKKTENNKIKKKIKPKKLNLLKKFLKKSKEKN
jgi:hypothetical protein